MKFTLDLLTTSKLSRTWNTKIIQNSATDSGQLKQIIKISCHIKTSRENFEILPQKRDYVLIKIWKSYIIKLSANQKQTTSNLRYVRVI